MLIWGCCTFRGYRGRHKGFTVQTEDLQTLVLYGSHGYNGAQRTWYYALVSMSTNRDARSLEILYVMGMQAATNLFPGPYSRSEVSAFRNPVGFEVETSMLHCVEVILLPLLEKKPHTFSVVGR